eukprot:2344185-Amphidinium_carterae.1
MPQKVFHWSQTEDVVSPHQDCKFVHCCTCQCVASLTCDFAVLGAGGVDACAGLSSGGWRAGPHRHRQVEAQ